jgi:hypothetical protein
MIRRTTAAALAVGVLGGAAAAEAAVQKGTYKGRSSQDTSVSFKVTSDSKHVIRFAFGTTTFTCDDGDTFTAEGLTTPASERLKIKRGKFGYTTVRGGGDEVTVEGRIKGRTASGAITRTARFNAQNEPDANGSVLCQTGPITWTAKTKAPKRRK